MKKKILLTVLLLYSTALFSDEVKPIYHDNNSYVYNLEKAILKAIDKIELLEKENKESKKEIAKVKEDLAENLLKTENLNKKILDNIQAQKSKNKTENTGSLTTEEIKKIEHFINN